MNDAEEEDDDGFVKSFSKLRMASKPGKKNAFLSLFADGQ
jgi:hypothetical protein